MQRPQEPREDLGLGERDRRTIGRLTLDPARDRSHVLEQARRLANTHRGGRALGQHRQPRLLGVQQSRRSLAERQGWAWSAYGQIVGFLVVHRPTE